jgi:CheY-like chemotaxis protein
MDGAGLLKVETERQTVGDNETAGLDVAPGEYICVRVIDHGVGMEAELIERIFEPFFTTKERGRGTGLGLATAYGIVRNHGGAIRVESSKGEGARFDMFLPVSRRQPASVTPNDQTTLARGTETILLVDDEPTVLDVTARLLERLGYSVLQAASGSAAVDVARASMPSIDLVILDMIMPELGGRRTFEALREVGCKARVLVASGYSIDGEVAVLLSKGADGFLAKPFDARTLSSKVRQVLDAPAG